jgi:hypothetical protein
MLSTKQIFCILLVASVAASHVFNFNIVEPVPQHDEYYYYTCDCTVPVIDEVSGEVERFLLDI